MSKGFVFGKGHGKQRGAKSGELKPVSHETTGKPITMANCEPGVCRWGYGLPSPTMILCGRPALKGQPWCAEHRKAAYEVDKKAKRL